MKHFLSIDQGTTSSRAIIFNSNLEPILDAQREYDLDYPNDGWVELNPQDVLETVLASLEQVLAEDIDIEACGITNQRETTIVWSKSSGKPIYPGIVWQDRRTHEFCNELKLKGIEDSIKNKTGLVLDPYFSATKIKWILENVKESKKLLKSNEVATFIKLIVSFKEFNPVPIKCLSLYLLCESLFSSLIFSEIEIS